MRKNFNKRAGFSLIEIVVVIAIMAIIAALLVPALIHYTEDSRAQKDITTMDEVVNAVQLALADSDCFDEMELYSCDNNFITYTDSSGKYGQQVIDAEYWAPDGCAKATTITFNPEKGPNGETIYRLENAVINDMTYGNGSIAISRPMEGAQVEDNQCLFPNAKLKEGMDSGYMYNKLKATIGTSVITTSATYANSSFTIFIKFSQKDGVTVADINGAFNGTNLTEDASASIGSGTNTEIINPDTGEKEQGPATEDGGTNKNNYTGSALQGGGSTFPGGTSNIDNKIEDYKEPSYIDYLQKEHEFEYYSSAALAAKDISDNTIGKRADRDKEDAVAGIYTDGAIPKLVILKDTHETEPIDLAVQADVILGGHTIDTDATVGIHLQKGGNVDGRISGSKIIKDDAHTDGEVVRLIWLTGSSVVNGGEYIHNNVGRSAYIISSGSTGAIDVKIKNVKVQAVLYEHKDNNLSYNVLAGLFSNSKGSFTIENCDVALSSQGKAGSVRCINALNCDLTVSDCQLTTYGNVQTQYNGSLLYSYAPIGIFTSYDSTAKNAKITQCNIKTNGSAVHLEGTSLVKDCALSGSNIVISCEEPTTKLFENCSIVFNSDMKGYINVSNNKLACEAEGNTVIKMNNCKITGPNLFKLYNNAKIYLSNTIVNEDGKINFYDTVSTLYVGARTNIVKSQANKPGQVMETSEIYNTIN